MRPQLRQPYPPCVVGVITRSDIDDRDPRLPLPGPRSVRDPALMPDNKGCLVGGPVEGLGCLVGGQVPMVED